MTSIYGPVTDWATDFDHAEPEYNENAPALWAQLRETCPVAHTDRYNGTWLPVTHELVTQIAYDTEHFTSRSVIVSPFEQLAPAPIGGAPPITSDPPFHHDARRLLLPAFAPKKIELWEADVRALCQKLLAALGDADVIDAAAQYAQHIPVNVIALMLGFPVEDADLFFGFVHDVIEGINVAPEERFAAFVRLDEYVERQVQEHVDNPRDDLTSFLLNATIDGQPLTLEHVGGSIVLLLIAGIDTTWSAISSSLLHLATHAEDRERLVADPSLIPTAIEEFLRAYAPVTMARMVKQDVEIAGCPMKVDEWVLLPFPAANVDPAAFDRADEVLIDRAENRHLAFGLGIHRCIGSNLARLELKVAVEEFLLRYPAFELDTADVTWSVGQIRGPRTVPVRVNA
ncbi:MAG: putative cytochrome [Ilumatobacteraceae bacterium]|nr:putative cytochrome [Ilumatobacteraceae bacterium]